MGTTVSTLCEELVCRVDMAVEVLQPVETDVPGTVELAVEICDEAALVDDAANELEATLDVSDDLATVEEDVVQELLAFEEVATVEEEAAVLEMLKVEETTIEEEGADEEATVEELPDTASALLLPTVEDDFRLEEEVEQLEEDDDGVGVKNTVEVTSMTVVVTSDSDNVPEVGRRGAEGLIGEELRLEPLFEAVGYVNPDDMITEVLLAAEMEEVELMKGAPLVGYEMEALKEGAGT